MTKDEIIELAKECGYWSGQTLEMNDVGLERFAALHRQALIDSGELVPREQVEAAVKAEREECANVAESERMEGPAPVGQIHPEIILAVEMTCRETGKSIAEKIRARSQP